MGEVQTTFEFQRFLCTDFMFLKGASWSVSQDYTVLDWDGERTSEGRRGVSSCLWLWLCNLELSMTSGRSYHSSLKVLSRNSLQEGWRKFGTGQLGLAQAAPTHAHAVHRRTRRMHKD